MSDRHPELMLPRGTQVVTRVDLRVALEDTHHASQLPEASRGRAALDDLLIRIRLAADT